MRSRGFIDANAKEVFNLLTSPKGYAILDPVSNPEDHEKPTIAEYEWKQNTRLEVAHADVVSKLMPKAEFVVLNATDFNNMIFVSKSIVHPKHPGYNIFYDEKKQLTKVKVSEVTRALNTMAIRVIETAENESELLVLNFVDMGMGIGKGTWLYNIINKHFFIPLCKRVKAQL